MTSVAPWLLLLVSTATPVARTDALIDAFKNVQVIGATGRELDEPQRRSNVEAFARLDGFFDYEQISLVSLGPLRQRFSAEQLERFNSRFREAIRLIAFPNAAKALREARYRLRPGEAGAQRGDVALVTLNDHDREQSEIVFRWRKTRGSWRVWDIVIEGASLVANYREQFEKLLHDGPVERLLAKLAERIDEKRRDKILAP